MENTFNQEEWNLKIREASKKWFEENPDYNPGLNYYDSGEITIPGDPGYYRVPMEMWEQYHREKYPEYGKSNLVKIVFQDGTQEDKQLSITVYDTINNEGKKQLGVDMASGEIMNSREPDIVSNIYFDIIGTLMKIQETLNSGKPYDGVHTLTRDEYKEYVTKVLGIKIPDQEK